MNIGTFKDVDLVIVGGGIFGAAISYYFKRDNPDKEVLVYERGELCSGNTGRAAALLSRIRPYRHVIPLSLETYRVIPELEKITGIRLPVHCNGSIHIAVRQEYIIALASMMDIATDFNIEWAYISANEASKLTPWLNAEQSEKIAYIPGEAVTDPYLLGMLFANAARAIGVKIIRNREVIEIVQKDNIVSGIRTTDGFQYAGKTVLAAGVWSTNLAWKLGIALPMAPVRSQYWITEQLESLFPKTSPSVLIPDASFYSRPQGNSLLFGLREANSVYADPRTLPDDISSYPFSFDKGWRNLEENYKKLLPFCPSFEDVGIKYHIAGFSGYTPDNQFIAGEIPEIDGILLATGCSGAGISVSGGIGLGIACMAAEKPNPFDFSPYRSDRFGFIDPYSDEHLSKCAAARSKKISG